MAKGTKNYSAFMNFLRTPTPTLIGIFIVIMLLFHLQVTIS